MVHCFQRHLANLSGCSSDHFYHQLSGLLTGLKRLLKTNSAALHLMAAMATLGCQLLCRYRDSGLYKSSSDGFFPLVSFTDTGIEFCHPQCGRRWFADLEYRSNGYVYDILSLG